MTSSVFVALVGRPNVGKSSLTNRLVGEKVAIVTSKPQTTRTRITGIVTRDEVQYVLLDTPGIHRPRTRLGERMGKAATDSIAEVDAALMLFEPYGELNESEEQMVADLKAKRVPAIAVINKTDTLKKPEDLELRRRQLEQLGVFEKVIAVSVKADELTGPTSAPSISTVSVRYPSSGDIVKVWVDPGSAYSEVEGLSEPPSVSLTARSYQPWTVSAFAT